MKKIFAILLTFAFLTTSSLFVVYAKGEPPKGKAGAYEEKVKDQVEKFQDKMKDQVEKFEEKMENQKDKFDDHKGKFDDKIEKIKDQIEDKIEKEKEKAEKSVQKDVYKQKSVHEDVYEFELKIKNIENDLNALKDMLKKEHKDMQKTKHLLKKIRDYEKKMNKKHSTIVLINGQENNSDVPPVIKYGRTLVPVRAITNGLGAQVDWNQATKTITVTKSVYSSVYSSVYNQSQIVVIIQLGSNIVKVNGVEVKIDVPAESISNRTFVPIRFLAEIFKLKVDFDKDNNSVIIEDEEETTAPPVNATPSPTPAGQTL